MLDDVNHCNVSRSDFPTFIPSHVPCEFHVNSMIKGGNRKHVIVKEPWSVLEQIQVVSGPFDSSQVLQTHPRTPIQNQKRQPTSGHGSHADRHAAR